MAAAFGQVLLATVFLCSGLPKLRDVPGLRRHIAATVPWLGPGPASVVAGALPVVELVTAVLVLTRAAWIGYTVATVLLLAFTVYLVGLLRSQPHASCGCAGPRDTPVSPLHVVRNVLLVTVCALTWWASALDGGPGATSYAVASGPAAVFGFAVLHLRELVTFFRPSRTA